MADLTVIEGGGAGRPPPDGEAESARRALRMMIVELLRALARGDDPELRIASLIVDFTRHASLMKTPLPSVVADVISAMSKEVTRQGPRGEADLEHVVSSALAVAGEICTDDAFAPMRIERKTSHLRLRIEQHIMDRETMAREYGQSYLVPLIKQEFPRQKKPRAKPPLGPGSRRK
jgi:hypothetical protein